LPEEIRIPINSDHDIVIARQKGRALTVSLGFTSVDSTLVATAISELARNIVTYAKHGEIIVSSIDGHHKAGVLIIARDDGPGIVNVQLAMRDSFSTSGSLGMGLPGARRMMDEFEITSEPGRGTTIKTKKWAR
jgi:serine/threonine-protein kinase RsbT